jgi:PAS domain S-box-containing protein
MESNHYVAQIDKLTEQVSELLEVNANLRLLDTVVRRNTALFEALLTNNSEGITLTGPDRRIVRVVKGLTGNSPRNLTGVLIESLAIPEDREIIVDCYEQLLHRDAPKVQCQIRVVRADGSTATFAVTMTDMLDDPNVQCIVWNYVDITGWKRQE